MNTLHYKGYLGKVDFSEEDNVFFGKIEGINGLVNFEGTTVEELKSAFYEAVDDYVLYCEENGLEPYRSYSGTLNIRISPDIHQKIALLAQKTGASINSVIKNALEKEVRSAMI